MVHDKSLSRYVLSPLPFILPTKHPRSGAAIMIMSLLLFETEFLNVVSISFTALVLNELIMVALQITIWHRYMIVAEVVTLVLYVGSMWILPEYFGEPLSLSLY